jgi:hypothetical protein
MWLRLFTNITREKANSSIVIVGVLIDVKSRKEGDSL